jgi:hypothetical protein
MTKWSLPRILGDLHTDIEKDLLRARGSGHTVAAGDASEGLWIEVLSDYLPERYRVTKGFVADSKNNFSDQIDVLICDRQYTPFILEFQGQRIIPAEAVYAAFEAKQAINAEQVRYAKKKIASVRALHRTSLPIPTATGRAKAKKPKPIIGGLLTLDSEWTPPLGKSLMASLNKGERLDIGCVVAHGMFKYQKGVYTAQHGDMPATAFLFELIARL